MHSNRIINLVLAVSAGLFLLDARALGGGRTGSAERPFAAPAPAPARCSGQPATRGGPIDVLGDIPRRVEVVVIVDNVSAMMGTPLGEAVWGLVADLDPADASRLARSWAALASQMGAAEGKAVGDLAGRRVVLMVSDVETPGVTRWAAVSTVSEQTERDLQSRLRPAARDVVEGRQILSIEDGAYELASYLREDEPAPPGGDGRRVSLLLAPTGRTELFDAVLRTWAGKGEARLSETEVVKEAAKLGSADVLVALRIDPDKPEDQRAGHDWDDFLLIAATRRDAGLECRVLVRDRGFERELGTIPVTSEAALRAISPGAVAAVVETRVSGQGTGVAMDRIWNAIGADREIWARLRGRQLLAVHRVNAAGGPIDPAGEASAGRMRLTLGAETSELAGLARLGDAFMLRSLSQMEQDRTGGKTVGAADDAKDAPPAETLDIAGVAMEAVRRTRVRNPANGVVARLLGAPMGAMWSFQPSAGPARPGAGGGQGENEDGPGWWLVGLGGPITTDGAEPIPPGQVDPFFALTKAVAGAAGDEGESRAWFSQGVIRPAAAAPLLETALPGIGQEWTRALRRLDLLSWRLYVNESRDLEGTIEIRTLAIPLPAPPAPASPAAPPAPPPER